MARTMATPCPGCDADLQLPVYRHEDHTGPFFEIDGDAPAFCEGCGTDFTPGQRAQIETNALRACIRWRVA